MIIAIPKKIFFSVFIYCLSASAYSQCTRNITSYGAIANDGLDDAAAINTAINACATGDVLCIPAGTFNISSPLTAKSNIHIKGAGQTQTIILLDKTSVTWDMLLINNASNVHVSDIDFNGNNNPNLGEIIFSHNSNGLLLNHLRLRNSASMAIRFTGDGGNYNFINGVVDSEVSDNTIDSIGVASPWGAAMRIAWGSKRNRFLRNTISNTGRGGILANDGSSDLIIKNNIISKSGLTTEKLAIEVWNECDRAVIEDNIVDHWLSIGGADQVAVRRNIISDTSGSVSFIGLESISKNSVYTDNIINGGQHIGISLSNRNLHEYFAYNKVSKMHQWGIQVQADNYAKELFFYKNTFEKTLINAGGPYPGADGHGIRLIPNGGPLNNIVWDGNKVTENKGVGFQFYGGDQLSIINNTISNNTDISLTTYLGSDLEWSNNTITGNGTNATFSQMGFTNQKPVADFNAPLTAYTGQAVSFTNTSTDTDGTIAFQLWDFNDSIPATTFNGSYTYSKPGVYRVTLIVWDNLGRASSKEKNITISNMGTSVASNANQQASFDLFPNPATDKITIEMADKIFETQIINALGAVVYSNSNIKEKITLSVAAWAKGIYFIKLTDKALQTVSTRKLVIGNN